MARKKSLNSYVLELKRNIRTRTGSDCKPWLLPQVRATAANMVTIDKIFDEIQGEKNLVTTASGSMGQAKSMVNPLVPYYDKMQRTLLLQFTALGLNYNATPGKITENTKIGGDEHDKLHSVLRDIAEME